MSINRYMKLSHSLLVTIFSSNRFNSDSSEIKSGRFFENKPISCSVACKQSGHSTVPQSVVPQ